MHKIVLTAKLYYHRLCRHRARWITDSSGARTLAYRKNRPPQKIDWPFAFPRRSAAYWLARLAALLLLGFAFCYGTAYALAAFISFSVKGQI